MTKRATKEAVNDAFAGPDYGAALAIINGRVASAKTAQSKASGDASAAWASIEKMGIHKGGAQAAAKVLGMEDDDDQQDWLRAFAKILEEAGITLKADLVDVAEGKHDRSVVPVEGLTPNHGRAEAPSKPEAKPGPAGDVDLNDGQNPPAIADKVKAAAAAEPPVERAAAPKKGGRPHLSVVEAKEAAAKHLGTPSPDAMH